MLLSPLGVGRVNSGGYSACVPAGDCKRRQVLINLFLLFSSQICEEGHSIKQHPAVSSVFYFDNIGGATAVFGQTKCPDKAGLLPVLPSDVAFTLPYPNQLFLFRGDLYHAVTHAPETPGHMRPTSLRPRRTLLINWWRTRPGGPADLPPCFIFDPSCASEGLLENEATSEQHKRVPPCQSDLNFEFEHDMEDWRQQKIPLHLLGDHGTPPMMVLYKPPAGAMAENDTEWPHHYARKSAAPPADEGNPLVSS
ncbi:hypothetical protein CYMTET_17289 [Cymbomonas tetramitiformis]|uniref:Uncharacterized protein n=1 Tax=Cymbomonas tetramitiformis TaxID=36881 RepID=A0AAE0GAP9_9CHLO|nr:hypothetical protein CYMTET_17289 [Cymbomonas tetramitiformis]